MEGFCGVPLMELFLPAEPRAGLLQRRQQILPDRAGQAGRSRRVPSHRHVHHAGESPAFFFFFSSRGLMERTARLLRAESITLAGLVAVWCHDANRAVCLMCSRVCALQHFSQTPRTLFTAAVCGNAAGEPLIIMALHYQRAPAAD